MDEPPQVRGSLPPPLPPLFSLAPPLHVRCDTTARAHTRTYPMTTQPPQAEQRHLAEILDYRHRLGVPEYLVRWRGEDLSGASWVVEEMLLTAAKDMVDSFQQQRAQMRREGKQRMEQPGSPQGVGSGAIDASDLEADVLDDQTTSAEQPLRNLSKRDAASGQVVSACAWDLSPSDLAELSAISDGWLSRFDAFFRPRLSQKHISILMRNICRLAQAEGADFGPPLGCYMQGRHLSLASDLRSLRRELSTACNGDFKKADSRTGGWKFSHPLCKLAEFQVMVITRWTPSECSFHLGAFDLTPLGHLFSVW